MNKSKKSNHLPVDQPAHQGDHLKQKCIIQPQRPRAGMTCPICKREILDYNGMLQLVCPQCGVLESGVFT